MSQEKYVAYVSTYTVGKVDKYGIRIYDVDLDHQFFLYYDFP